MADEAREQIDDSSCVASMGLGLQFETPAVQMQAISSLGNGFRPKVRKPYTITKQRKKWTEEEHQRFLEALKLYGRAWSQIEEHVGTKTAIQIRSHAQKFFAKVTRESNADCEGSLNAIEIPPPRPKKKPLYPYPRKVVDHQKVGDLDPNQTERSPPRKASVGERESKSPTSVLSALGSETCNSPFSEWQKPCLSPSSCTMDDDHSANVVFGENDNACMTSKYSVGEEKLSFESIQVSATATKHDKSIMDLDFLTQGQTGFREDPHREATSSTIKLFGKAVMVNEDQKSSSPDARNHESSSSDATQEKHGIGNGLPALNTADNVDPQFAYAHVPGCFAPVPILLPTNALSKEFSHSGAVPFGISWWGWHQGLMFPQVVLGNLTTAGPAVEYPEEKREPSEHHQQEGSSTGSNSGLTGEVNSVQRNLDTPESKRASKVVKQGSTKGFIPYKRCLAETDAASPLVAAKEDKGQRLRVCS